MTNNEKKDYIQFAIDYGKKLDNRLKNENNCQKIDAFKNRAKDFPSLVVQEGLVPALTFYYAKAEGKIDDISKISCDELSNEGRGYSAYMGFLMDALRNFASLKCENALSCIEEVRKNELIITNKILPVLIEMKKISSIVGGQK
jgi:CRISPR type III-B/RAMP module-associated protein Cmr5